MAPRGKRRVLIYNLILLSSYSVRDQHTIHENVIFQRKWQRSSVTSRRLRSVRRPRLLANSARPRRWSIFQSDGMVNVFFSCHHWGQWFFDGFDNVGPSPLNVFLRAQPLVSMVFRWFSKFWGQWSTMVLRLTMVWMYHWTLKVRKINLRQNTNFDQKTKMNIEHP